MSRVALGGVVVLVVAGVLLVGAFVFAQPADSVNRLVALGTLAASLATVALAGMTYATLRESARQAAIGRDAVEEARKVAAASVAQADASIRAAMAAEESIAEMRRARASEYRPHLAVAFDAPGGEVGTVTNVGRGPALDCRLNAHSVGLAGDAWLSIGPFDLAASDSATFEGSPGSSDDDRRFQALTEDLGEVGIAVVYDDLMGVRYRTVVEPARRTEAYAEEDGVARPLWAR